LGIVVDSVTEVVSIAASDIEDTPNFGEDAAVPFLMGMAKTKGRVKLLLDIDAVLASHELRLKHQSIKN
ncbi:MAG: chemotaxis protein CheW, partial [Acidobacteriaceae bacterium]|nr:chemotaxis protein CheW [Acidobacteriaceae bacterium]